MAKNDIWFIDYIKTPINSWYIKFVIFSILSLSNPSCNVENDDIQSKTTITLKQKEQKIDNKDDFDIYKINEQAEVLLWDEKYDLALEKFIMILKFYDTGKDTLWLMSTYSKIGNIHYEQDLYEKALTSFDQSLKLANKLDNKLRQIKNYNNIAKSFYYENNIPLSSTAYNEALKIFDDWWTNTNNKDVLKELVKTYEWLAWISHKNWDKKKLQEYMNFALNYSEQAWDNELEVAMILNISEVKYTIWDINWALRDLLYNQKEIELLNVWHYNERLYRNLSYFYKEVWDFKHALIYKNKEIEISIEKKNSESERIQADMEAQYKSEKKDQEIKTQQAELKAKTAETYAANTRADSEEKTKWLLFGILWAFGLWWIFWLIQYRKKNKQKKNVEIAKEEAEQQKSLAEDAKEEAEEQKRIAEQKTEEVETVNEELIAKNTLIEQKHKELLEQKEQIEEAKSELEEKHQELFTVNYELKTKANIIEKQQKHLEFAIEAAKNQQKARLPSQSYINKIFIENMILYKPKDKVSWDFYFVEQLWDIQIFATLDSTWHWVEWAMTSVAWLTSLRNSTKQWISDPSTLINRLNTSIYDSTWSIKNKESIAKYTMEWTIISYDENTWDLNFSWSKWEIFVFPQNNKHNIKEHNIKKWDDKQWFRVKKHQTKEWIEFFTFSTEKEFLWNNEKSNFKNYSINIDNAKIVMFSDWYQDQFWWENGKKLKKKAFRELIANAVTDWVDLWDTQRILEEYLTERIWNNEQIDDIAVTWVKLEKKEMA